MKKTISIIFIIFLLMPAFLLITPFNNALAVQPDEILSDSKLEKRAREISKGLRCLVCQNQSIDDSNADLAKDLRIIVRERLLVGDSDKQVEEYLIDRYGNYVLLEPPVNSQTMILWLGPLIILSFGMVAVAIWYRGIKKTNNKNSDDRNEDDNKNDINIVKLNADEQLRLDTILKE